MPQQGPRPAADVNPTEFAMAQAEHFSRFQTELLAELDAIGRHWTERAQTEMKLALEFVPKAIATGTASGAASLWQEWTAQYLKRAAEDVSYALEATRSLAEVSTGQLPHGDSLRAS